MEKFDLTVIGAGPGGYPAAIRAAQMGASVALIEKEAPGGTCLNWGCIPTKSLIAVSDLYWKMNHCADFGLSTANASFDYAAITERKDRIVDGLRRGIGQLLKSNGVKVYDGTASFVGGGGLAVAETGSRAGSPVTVQSGNIIIATGSESIMPRGFPGSKRVMDSKAFLQSGVLPQRVIVMGGGVIGCEFACLAAQLGAEVTIVELLDDILTNVDPDVRKVLRHRMERELGITVLTGKPLEQVRAGADGVDGAVDGNRIDGDLLLVCVGRRPVTRGLNPDKAGVPVTDSGHIEIDAHCRTRRAGIYAVGDVAAGSVQLAHAATSQGIVAAENAVGNTRREVETVVPACIFTAPEIGCAGLTEQAAAQAGREIKTGKFQFAALGKAVVSGDTAGFVKWICDSATGRLLGAQAVGMHATELISEAAVAIRAELTADEAANTIHCHPTLSEAWMEAAHAVHGRCIHQPGGRRRS